MKTALSIEGAFEHSSLVVLYVKLILTAMFWGGTFVAGRVVAQQIDPFSAAFLRFVIASLFLLAFVWGSQGRIPKLLPRDILLVVLLGLSGVFSYNILFFSGLKAVTASRASLIIASNPAFIALFSCLFFHERLDLLKIVGICLSMSGAVVVISQGDPLSVIEGNIGLGELYIFGCVLSWVAYSLIGKAALKRLSPLIAVTYSCIFGAALLAFPAYAGGLRQHLFDCTTAVWLGVFYLGFFGSALGFFWYYEGIKAIGAARAGVFINIVPVCAVFFAYLMLNEAMDKSLLMGAILVMIGVYCTNKPR